MPDNKTTSKAVAKAHVALTRAKHSEDKEAIEKARRELKEAIAAFDAKD